MKAPRRGMPSPPRLEPSGSERSHEPQTRSVNSTEKATAGQRTAEGAESAATAKPGVSVKGMREAISAGTSDGALLRRGMPGEGAALVAMEEPSTVAAVGERAEKAAAAKCSPSRAAAAGWRGAARPQCSARGSSQGATPKYFSATAVTARVATNASSERGGRHCSDFALSCAGARWNVCWNGNDAGESAVWWTL